MINTDSDGNSVRSGAANTTIQHGMLSQPRTTVDLPAAAPGGANLPSDNPLARRLPETGHPGATPGRTEGDTPFGANARRVIA